MTRVAPARLSTLPIGRRLRTTMIVGATVAVVGVLIAIAGPSSKLPAAHGAFAVGDASERWPSEDLQDWASYADQFSEITVTGDRELLPPDVGTSGGYHGRAITVEVDNTTWTRPGAPELVGNVEMTDYGWLEVEGDLLRFTTEGGVWLEVGERYAAPLVRSDEGTWTILSPSAIVKLEPESGRAAGDVDIGRSSPALEAVAGSTASEVGDTLRETEPDPLAAKYAERPPEARWQAVAAERAQNTPVE